MTTSEPSDQLPLADVLRATNDLVAAGLIEDWALGGALAAIYYVEPFTTYAADIFFIPKDKGLTADIPAIYAQLQAQGWKVEREHLLLRGFPVQFLAARGLTEEAVREALRIDYEGVSARVFRPEHIVAIAASVGRAKDKARIEQLQEQADLDQSRLESILSRHNLKLPAHESGDATKTSPRTVCGKDPQSGATHPFSENLPASPTTHPGALARRQVGVVP